MSIPCIVCIENLQGTNYGIFLQLSRWHQEKCEMLNIIFSYIIYHSADDRMCTYCSSHDLNILLRDGRLQAGDYLCTLMSISALL